MERRLLLAILLTFLVLTVYQWMLPKAPPPTASSVATATGAKSSDAAAPPPASQAAPLPPVETLVADATEKTVTVDNGIVRAMFSNRGGIISRWELTQYRDNAGQPLDLIPHDVPADAPRPF